MLARADTSGVSIRYSFPVRCIAWRPICIRFSSRLRAPVPVARALTGADSAEAEAFPAAVLAAAGAARFKLDSISEIAIRTAFVLALLVPTSLFSGAQQIESPQPALTVRSTLVMVPALVTNKSGKVVFELTADDFL